jgi:ribonuclease HII
LVRLIGGADDAGRGPLVGPLVIAGVSMEPKSARALKRRGVRDSKTLSPKQREALYEEILLVSNRVASVMIQPNEIDEVVMKGRKYRKLNYLEALYFAKVADELGASELIVDASDSSPRRFRDNILEHMKRKCKIIAAHKADRDYAVVSAASIIAKVERDRAVEKLKRKLGDFGSGYPSDPITRAFFLGMLKRGEPLPDQVRKSWRTLGTLQQTLLAPL